MSKIVVLDFGHGGRDPGAKGKTTYEKNNNLTLGLKIGKILKEHNVDVNYTRTTDKDFNNSTYDTNIDLQNRIAVAKQFTSDIMCSLHNNAFNQQAKGIEVHCFKFGGGDQKLAQRIMNQLSNLNFINRGIKASNFFVLRKFDKTNTDACLVEYGFIDSEEDKILENMDKAALLISKGILEHLGIKYSTNNNKREGEDVLDVAILLYTKEDYWAGTDVSDKNGNCAIFIRPADKSVPKDAMNSKKLYVIGGETVKHPNEILLSGSNKYGTAQAVYSYLQGK